MLKPVLSLLLFSAGAFAQLTQDQKIADFMQLAGLYAKHYEPYSWKRDVIGFDLYDVKPWIERVKQTNGDLDFYDLCVRYVAGLKDSHDEFFLPSDFQAYLNFRVDIYDGMVLIDSIDRSRLPQSRFPFAAGDEVVSVDGEPAADVVTSFLPYSANGAGNPVSQKRLAADTITLRNQFYFPRAHEVGETSEVVIRRQNGALETYTIPWRKFGTPLTKAGRVPSPTLVSSPSAASPRVRDVEKQVPAEEGSGESAPNPWGVWTGPPMTRQVEVIPEYMKPLRELQTMEALRVPPGIVGVVPSFSALTPVFNPPAGFRMRLGGSSVDQFLSGTFPAGGKTIGFIRIPSMSPSNTTLALAQFRAEVAFFNQNTDALVVDLMRNGGGSLCYAENLAQYLIPRPFRSIAYEIRATSYWVQVYSSFLYSAILNGADQWVIDLYGLHLRAMQEALKGDRASTGDLPICGPYFEGIEPFRDASGNVLAYTKPMLALVDDFTISAGEAFAAILQDEKRASIFGTRTDGAGGNPATYTATTYSEGQTRVTRTLVTRGKQVATPGFPPSRYLENTGVYPDIVNDYMTKENLLTRGAPFIGAFTAAVLSLLTGN
jgi:hypothetical protein